MGSSLMPRHFLPMFFGYKPEWDYEAVCVIRFWNLSRHHKQGVHVVSVPHPLVDRISVAQRDEEGQALFNENISGRG